MRLGLSYRIGPFGLIILGMAFLALIIDAIVILAIVVASLFALFLLWRAVEWSVYAIRSHRHPEIAQTSQYAARHYAQR